MKIKKHCSFIITSIVSFIMFTMVFDFFTVSAKGGISLSGQVISVNPHSETSVLLKQKDEVKYSTVIVGSDNVIQSFSFQGILPGMYDYVDKNDSSNEGEFDDF